MSKLISLVFAAFCLVFTGGVARAEAGASVRDSRVTIKVAPYERLEPRLTLRRDPGVVNGWLGSGWRLDGLPIIERVPGHAGMHFDENDTFTLDGVELVPCKGDSVSQSCKMGGTHASSVRRDVRIEHDESEDRWVLWRDDGVTSTLGSLVKTDRGTTKWALTEVRDGMSHRVSYGYTCKGTECYPENIAYEGSEIRFFFEPRPDRAAPAAGNPSLTQRLRSIDVRSPGKYASYDLGYAMNKKGVSVIASVEEPAGRVDLDVRETPNVVETRGAPRTKGRRGGKL